MASAATPSPAASQSPMPGSAGTAPAIIPNNAG